MLSRAYESLGAGILNAAKAAQRMAVRAQLKQHRDQRGRVTPYLECGTAKLGTLVWLHGFSDEPDTFLRTAQPLVRDFRVVAPALPGFGAGWVEQDERYAFEAYADWLTAVASDLGGERFHLMGNSLGGGAALAIAAKLGAERIASLIPVNSGGLDIAGVRSVNDEMRAGQNLFALRETKDYESFLRRIFAEPPFIPGPVRAHLASNQCRAAQWYERLVADLLQSAQDHVSGEVTSIVDLKSLRVPTLVVWGDRDTLFPLAHGEHLARAIPGAQLEVLRGVGHCPHLERPALLAKAFRRFATQSSQ